MHSFLPDVVEQLDRYRHKDVLVVGGMGSRRCAERPLPYEYLSLSVTVVPVSPWRRRRRPTDSPNSAIAASMSPRSVKSFAKVRSLLTDLTSRSSSSS